MGVPATTGQLKTRIQDMEIGDYIVWSYSNSTGHVMGDTKGFPELPYTVANGSLAHYWYGIKVDRGLIISDRVVVHSWSWDGINSFKSIQGLPITLSGITGIIRSLTGGVAYADAFGNISLIDNGYGAWPTNNEWDKYIANFPQRLIQSGNTLDDVFHWSAVGTWTQDTVISNYFSSNTRVIRGANKFNRYNVAGAFNPNVVSRNTVKEFCYSASNTVSVYEGFRPVFEYKEV